MSVEMGVTSGRRGEEKENQERREEIDVRIKEVIEGNPRLKRVFEGVRRRFEGRRGAVEGR